MLLPILALTPAAASGNRAFDEAMTIGRAALDAGRPGDARAAFRAAIAADRSSGAAHAMQARASIALGDAAAAEAEIERAAKAGAPRSGLALLRAEAALLRGEAERALAAAAGAGGVQAAQLRGRAWLALGELPRAEAEFDAAVKAAPDNAAAWIDLARFRQAAGDTRGAIAAAERATALAPGSAEALVLRGVLVRTQYGLVASLPWFEAALARDAAHLGALIEAAATSGEAGRARDMLALTRRVLAIDPTHPRAWFLQAALAARAGQFGLARALFARTRGRIDGQPAAMLLGAALEIEGGAHALAVTRLERLTTLQPDNHAARRLLALARLRAGDPRGSLAALVPIVDAPDAEPYSLALAGRAHEALGDRALAGRALDLAARAEPGGPTALPVRDGLPPAVRRLRAGLAAGLDDAVAARAGSPGVAAAHVLVGDALASRGDWAEAARAYADAGNIAFTEATALRLIDALGRAGRAADARRALTLLLAQHPRSRAAAMLAAEARRRGGDHEGAIALLEGLRARGPRDAMVLANLSWAWLEAGDAERARSYARSAYRLAPANAAVADGYGWMMLQSGGDRGAALTLLAKAEAIAPGAPWLHGQQARTLLAAR